MIWLRDGMGARKRHDELKREDILHGLDGYLFMRLHCAFEQIFEGLGFDDAGAAVVAAALERRRAWCAARGSTYRFLVVPEQITACADKVPGAPVPSDRRPIMQISRQPGTSPALLYPLDALQAATARYPTYQHDDVHLSSYGAFIAYQALMRALPGTPPESIITEDQLTRVEKKLAGGYSLFLGLPKFDTLLFQPPPVKHNKLVNDTRMGIGRIDLFETERTDLPRLVMFRTSNTTALIPYLLHHSCRIVAFAGPHFL
jgi:hypothetical protein